MIPQFTKECIDRYVNDRVPPGDFVQAVLENDLREAFGRADDNNIANMFSIVQYCYSEIPESCWGSTAKVRSWLHPEIKSWTWRACEDDAVCPECMRLVGNKMSKLDIQRLKPPLHDGCRCVLTENPA